jgi:hypothetical protein
VVGDVLREYILTALGALAAIYASYLAIRANRRDRVADQQAKRDEKVEQLGNRQTHVEGFLEAKHNDFHRFE